MMPFLLHPAADGQVLGVEVRAASLILDEMDNFIETRFSIQKRNPGVFSYRSIQIEFGPTFFMILDCLNKHNKERPGMHGTIVGIP